MAKPKKHVAPKNPPADAAQTAAASVANEIKTKLEAFASRLASHGVALTPVESQAFTSAATDAECAAVGARTRSDLVLSGALGLIALAEQPLGRYTTSFPYSSKRYLFLVSCAQDLASKASAQSTSTVSVGAARQNLKQVTTSARAARNTLLAYLTPVARGNATVTAAIDAQLGVPLTEPASLAATVKALAQVAQSCVSSTDPTMAARCAGANLTQAVVTAATNAAAALAQADSAAAGTQRATDNPEVNTAEGRVLIETRELVAAFKAAHATNPNIPELAVPPGMRAGVGIRRAKTATKGKAKSAGTKASAAKPAAASDTTSAAASTANTSTPAKGKKLGLKGHRAKPRKRTPASMG